MAEPLICGCSPEQGVCCDRCLDLMTDVRYAMSQNATEFGFQRLSAAKQRLAEHYRAAEEARACSR